MRQKQGVFSLFLLSPSSRRAWIEIFSHNIVMRVTKVALLAEGVDRNKIRGTLTIPRLASPSSRRAWIEITLRTAIFSRLCVALLAEGVDRNSRREIRQPPAARRPPRGGRG